MMHADAAANTRDMSAAADGERVVRCILKKGDSIAAQRCLDTQEENLCFCPAAYGALKGTEVLLGPNAHPNDGEAIAQLSKQRIRLSMLKARSSGFAKKGQEYSGPALALINAELQRRAKERAAKGPAPVVAPIARAQIRAPSVKVAPAPFIPSKVHAGATSRDVEPTAAIGVRRQPEPGHDATGDSSTPWTSGAPRVPNVPSTAERHARVEHLERLEEIRRSLEVPPGPRGRKQAVPICAQVATEVAPADTKVSKEPRRLTSGALIPEVLPKPARTLPHEQVQRDLLSALHSLGFKLKVAEPAASQAMRTIGPAPVDELLVEALRLIREGVAPAPPAETVQAAPSRKKAHERVCSYEGCKEPINAGNKSNRCGPHSRINRKRSTPAGLKTCPRCFRKRYALRESGICGTCESSSEQRVTDRVCAHPEGCTTGITRWNKSGLCERHASRERVRRHYAAKRELRESGVEAAGELPDPRLLPHPYLVRCVEEAMRRREALTKAIFPSIAAHAPGADSPDRSEAAQSVAPASVGKATA